MDILMPVSLKSFLKDIDNFILMPTVAINVNRLVDDPSSSVIDIANEISKDPALTAQVLKVANSAYFGFPSRIDSIPRAVSIIGTDELRNLVLMLSVVKSTAVADNVNFELDDFWRHCFFTGLMARRLAREVSTPVLNKERMLLAGVLHEMGRLVFALKIPELFQVIQERASTGVEPFYRVEKLEFGLSHTDIVAELLKKWSMPMSLIQTLRYQHHPELSKHTAMESAILLLANDVSSEMGLAGIADDNLVASSVVSLGICGLTRGQVLEIAAETRDEYFTLINEIYTPIHKFA